MATLNPFDLLGDDDNEDPTQLIAAQQLKAPAPAPAPAPAANKKAPASKPASKFPSKPPPPPEAVKEARGDSGYRGGRGAGRGGGGSRGRSGRGFSRDAGFTRDSEETENAFRNSNGFSGGYRNLEDGDSGKHSERRPYGGPRGVGGFRGGRRFGSNNEENSESDRPRRVFERRSGTGRGNEVKREGAGRGNWGTPTDEIAPENEGPVIEGEKNDAEKQPGQEEVSDVAKDSSANEEEVKEPEQKEMTLEEYQKVVEEKRKALLALRSEERKVNLDKELASMQLLSNKKNDDEIFIKLGSDKDKRREASEKVKKAVSINEFLKPAEGENYHRRGRGRERGRGVYAGTSNNVQTPAIGDVGQFPSLGGK